MNARTAAAVAAAASCTDSRCTDGLTACEGCHGWGVVNPKGKAYRWAHKGDLPSWAVPHADCNGTGLRECGCTPLGATERASLAGLSVAS